MEGAGDGGLLLELMRALEASGFARTARASTWIYPLASVLHILGLAALLGAIAAYDLRLLGFARRVPPDALGAFLLPVARAAFAVQVVTGLTMFATDASHLYGNPFLIAKSALILAALANILVFYARLRADPAFHARGTVPGWARIGAALSLAAWTAVAVCGRMIAYV